MPNENKKLSAEEIRAAALVFTDVINVHEEPYGNECVDVECTSYEIYLAMHKYAARQTAPLEAETDKLNADKTQLHKICFDMEAEIKKLEFVIAELDGYKEASIIQARIYHEQVNEIKELKEDVRERAERIIDLSSDYEALKQKTDRLCRAAKEILSLGNALILRKKLRKAIANYEKQE